MITIEVRKYDSFSSVNQIDVCSKFCILVFDDNDALFAREIREQAMVAIDEAVGVILVVDGMCSSLTQDIKTDMSSSCVPNLPVLSLT